MVTIEISENDAAMLDEIISYGIVCHCPHITQNELKEIKEHALKMHGKHCKDSEWEPVAHEVNRQMAEQTNKVQKIID